MHSRILEEKGPKKAQEHYTHYTVGKNPMFCCHSNFQMSLVTLDTYFIFQSLEMTL